jgi:predicted AAA+ superfamily ATPase
VDVGADGTLFRAYDAGEFLETGSWQRLRTIIATGNGGVYGLYGPRGSGKSWLMHPGDHRSHRRRGDGALVSLP